MNRHSIINILIMIILGLTAIINCEKKPIAPQRDNPFDPQNIKTGGDPFKLTAKIANGGILLEWNKPSVDDLKSFNIYRSEQGISGYSKLENVNANTTNFTDTDIANGHSYWYLVTAVSYNGNESSRTNLVPVNINANPVLTINGGAIYTPTRDVDLTILASTARQIKLSNSADFNGAQWESYVTGKSWELPTGAGEKTVYLKVKYENGQESQPISATIKPQPMNPSIVIIADTVEYTPTRNVPLKLSVTGAKIKMKLSEDSTLSRVQWQNYQPNPFFQLSAGDGVKKVYAKFKNDFEIESQKMQDDIIFDTTPPTLVLTITPDSGVVNETTFWFDPTASSDNLTPQQDLRVRFAYENDATFDTDWIKLQTANYKFQDGGGDRDVKIQLRDKVGWISETIQTIFVNTRPLAEFSYKQTSHYTLTMKFNASASYDDEDGRNLQYRWDFDNDGVFDTNWLIQNTISHAYDHTGTYLVKLSVRDQNRLTGQKIQKIKVRPPFIKMVFVEGGTFQMGDTWGDGGSDEKPVHTVTVDSFYIGKYEVTQPEYLLIMKNNPSHFTGGGDFFPHPVEQVSWYDAVNFCNQLSIHEGLEPCYTIKDTDVTCDFTKNGYRLPTEAEWEYAARGGNQSQGYKYSGSNNPDDVAWYSDNSGNQTHEVGTKQPNELGIYDMTGNVWEWCWDWYDSEYYSSSPQDNPKGPDSGTRRVLRGGGWLYRSGTRLGVANRSSDFPSYSHYDIGFRLVRKK